MLTAACVVPAPPLLVPDLANGAAVELDDVRAVIRQGLDALAATAPDVLVCVGGGDTTSTYPSGSRGSFGGFGVSLDVTLGAPGEADVSAQPLPVSLTVLAWLLTDYAWRGEVEGLCVASDTEPSDALKLGEALVGDERRVALLVGGDGSAALTEKAPGYLIDSAAHWQSGVSQALAEADVEGIAALSSDDGLRYVAAGRAAWQVLAGAARGRDWRGHQLASVAPYGVAYDVVTWEPA